MSGSVDAVDKMAYIGDRHVDTIHGGGQNAGTKYTPKEKKNGKFTSDNGAPMRTAERDPGGGGQG